MTTNKKSRKYLKIVGYNLLVIFSLFCILELGLNYYLNNPSSAPSWLKQSLISYYSNCDRKIIQYLPECAHYSDELYYELNPGEFRFSNREFDNQYSINTAGFRDDEFSLEHPKIVVLGDSYSMGWGVDQNESFPQIIERKLGLKTLNTGVSSYGTAREVHSLKKVNMDSLQYVILQYCPNDFNENKQFFITNDSLVISSEDSWNKNSSHHSSTTDYYLFKHTYHILSSFRKSTPLQVKRASSKANISISEEHAFLNVLKKTRYIPDHVQIVLFSLESESCHNYFITKVQKLLEKEHGSSLHDRISFIDLTGEITKKERFFMDPHINKIGHQVVAEKIISHIKSLDLTNEKEYWHYENGQLGYVCDYKNGVKHGTFTSYWINGNLSRIGHYENGVKQGEEVNYNEKGGMSERKHYINDVLSGIHITYDSIGKVIDSIYIE